MYQLLIHRAGETDRTVELGEGSWLVGRDASAHIHLDHDTVSRRHLLFSHTGQRLVVEDLSTTNGTRVNGIDDRSRVLAIGDFVEIGPWLLTVESSEAEGDAPPTFSGMPPTGAETVRASADELEAMRQATE